MKKSGLDSDEASGDLKETCREGAFPHLCFLLPPFPFFLSSTQDSCFLSFLLSPPSQYPFLFFSLSSMPVPSSLCLSQTNPPSSSLPQANIFFSLPSKPLPYFLPPPPILCLTFESGSGSNAWKLFQAWSHSQHSALPQLGPELLHRS